MSLTLLSELLLNDGEDGLVIGSRKLILEKEKKRVSY
jgi:hypothetical protein